MPAFFQLKLSFGLSASFGLLFVQSPTLFAQSLENSARPSAQSQQADPASLVPLLHELQSEIQALEGP